MDRSNARVYSIFKTLLKTSKACGLARGHVWFSFGSV